MEIKFAKSARKHRIGKGRALHVIANTEAVEATLKNGDAGLSWIGLDDRGLELEILGRIKSDRVTGEPIIFIVHVMPTTWKESK